MMAWSPGPGGTPALQFAPALQLPLAGLSQKSSAARAACGVAARKTTRAERAAFARGVRTANLQPDVQPGTRNDCARGLQCQGSRRVGRPAGGPMDWRPLIVPAGGGVTRPLALAHALAGESGQAREQRQLGGDIALDRPERLLQDH